MGFKPQNTIGFLVRQTGRTLRIKVNQEIKALGYDITMEQGGVLMRLCMGDGIQQGELAVFLGKDKTTVARLLDGMEKSSLIVRVSGKIDKRSKEIYITQKGKELQEVIKNSIMKVLGVGLNGIEKEEVEIAKKVLKQMINNLGHFGIDSEIINGK